MPERGAGLVNLRSLAVIVVALLLSLVVVLTAVVSAPFEDRLAIAARLWPSHPVIILDRSMAEIGTAAARGQPVPEVTLRSVQDLARKAPLAAEPFLIEGALAQTRGQETAAERLFLEARTRDPRSEAVRYFLADRYVRTGRIFQGLVEMAALARLKPSAAGPLVPALAAFSKTPGAVPQLKKFFRQSPMVETGVLSLLSADAKNADLILALADIARSQAAPGSGWQERIVSELVNAGDYAKAYSTWTRLTGVRPAQGLFNPGFRKSPAPYPFNWRFTADSSGLAEPAADDRLQIIHYGRQEAVFASQLLLLPPGRYRLGMDIAGDIRTDGLQWTIGCAPGSATIMQLPLGASQRGKVEASFSVPPTNCPAQWLQLRGAISESPQTSELTIGKLALTKDIAA